MAGPSKKEIRIEDEVDDVGSAPVELHPKDRARLRLAGQVLLAVLGVVILALAAVLWCPADRLDDAKEFLSFVKTVAPPLVTLVLGFYFNSQGDNT